MGLSLFVMQPPDITVDLCVSTHMLARVNRSGLGSVGSVFRDGISGDHGVLAAEKSVPTSGFPHDDDA